nr:hypothetical protein [Spirochaetales bacterium]
MGTKIFRRAFWRIVSGSLSYPDGIDATPVGQTTPAKVTGTDVEATGNFIGNGAELTGITGATGGVANEGSTTIGAVTVDDGSGEIALQIGLTTQYTLDNDGYFKKDASAPAPAADEDIITRGYADSRYLSTWANAYGIRWDAVNDIIQPGIIVSNEFFSLDYTSMPVHDKCGRRCVTNASNVLQYYLHPDDSTLKASGEAANIDGTDGQVMSEFTAFHSLLVNDGNYRYRLVGERPFNLTLSDDSVVGSTLNPWFFEGGSYSEKRYVGAFEGVLYDDTVSDYIDGDGTGQYAAGDKVHSVAGYTPITSESRPTFRTACAVDGDYHQHGFFGEEALLLLYITKYKDWDSQTELPGYTEGGAWDFAKVCKTGITKTLGNHDGSINWEDADATLRCATDQTGLVVVNSFLGIENY